MSSVFLCVCLSHTHSGGASNDFFFSSPAIFYSCEGKSIKPKQSSCNATNLLNLHPGGKKQQKQQQGLSIQSFFFFLLCVMTSRFWLKAAGDDVFTPNCLWSQRHLDVHTIHIFFLLFLFYSSAQNAPVGLSLAALIAKFLAVPNLAKSCDSQWK